jgi:hypothetical protein
MSNKQTAVEWIEDKIQSDMTFIEILGLIRQAKEMHKQEVTDAWEDGHDSFSTRNAEQYYKETFNVEPT